MQKLLFLLILLAAEVLPVSGQSNGLPFNWTWSNGPYSNHAFEIATLAASSSGTYDHLHLVATTNVGDYSGGNATIDATFGNRGGLVVSFTVRGAPVTGCSHLAAYGQPDGSVNLYFMFCSYYVAGSYTVLENIQENVYANPVDIGNATPPGTLLWDSANAAETQQQVSFNGNTGIGTNTPDAELSISTSNPGSETGIHVANPEPTGFSVLRLGPADTAAQTTGFAIHSFNSAWGADPTSAVPPSTTSMVAFDQGGMILDTLAAAPIRFFTSGISAGNERMRIDPAGNVGIGTASPAAKLEVNGNLKADGSTITVGSASGIFGDAVNTVVLAPPNGSIYFSPLYNDGTRISADGSLRIGGPNQPTAGLVFPDGSVQTKASNLGSSLTSSANGNLGVGTSNAASPLSVSGGVSVGAGYSSVPAPSNGEIIQGSVGIGTSDPNSWSAVSGVPGTNLQVRSDNSASRLIINSTINGAAELHMVNGAAAVDQHNHRFTATPAGLSLDQPTDNYAMSTPNMFWGNNGNVGIGTSTPSSTLEIDGNVTISGTGAGIYFPHYSTPQTIPWTGSLYGQDYADAIDVTGDRTTYRPGDVLVIDPTSSRRFRRSSEPYSTLAAGVYSTKPGVVGRQSDDSIQESIQIPLAMVGIVPTRVSAENGPIETGDLLVTSATPGCAMKGTNRQLLTGAVLGKALGTLRSGTGVIEVLISLQ